MLSTRHYILRLQDLILLSQGSRIASLSFSLPLGLEAWKIHHSAPRSRPLQSGLLGVSQCQILVFEPSGTQEDSASALPSVGQGQPPWLDQRPGRLSWFALRYLLLFSSHTIQLLSPRRPSIKDHEFKNQVSWPSPRALHAMPSWPWFRLHTPLQTYV